ncbi:MAG: hypothetical protein WD872_20895 [Pirellulaceae bacterium]
MKLGFTKSAKPPTTPADQPASSVLADRALVDRCLACETGAWSMLYQSSHEGLLSSIRSFMGRGNADATLVDEIAARVWYALVRNNFDLLSRFDVGRGCRLSTFLTVLAKTEARLLLRSERRRRVREQAVSRSEIAAGATDLAMQNLSEEEFVATLSPTERVFYEDVLKAAVENDAQPKYSQQNTWQLRHRVRKKLERFLGDLGQ